VSRLAGSPAVTAGASGAPVTAARSGAADTAGAMLARISSSRDGPCRSRVAFCTSRPPALHRTRGEVGPAEGGGVPPFDLVAHLVQRRGGAGAAELAHRLQRAGHRLLHLGLLELAEQLGALGQLLLQQHRVVLDRLAGLLGGAERLVVQGLEVLDRALGRDQLGGERLRGLLVVLRLGGVAVGARLLDSTSAWRAFDVSVSTSVS
jgi:hypothetical protein